MNLGIISVTVLEGREPIGNGNAPTQASLLDNSNKQKQTDMTFKQMRELMTIERHVLKRIFLSQTKNTDSGKTGQERDHSAQKQLNLKVQEKKAFLIVDSLRQRTDDAAEATEVFRVHCSKQKEHYTVLGTLAITTFR